MGSPTSGVIPAGPLRSAVNQAGGLTGGAMESDPS